MTKKTTKPSRMAPLQKLVVKPIEDPAEQAALDERLKQNEEAVSAVDMASGARSKVTGPGVLEVCRQLSPAARLLVATELTAQLSLEQRIELLERWAAQLPPEVMQQFAERLRGRSRDAAEDGKRRG